MERLSSETSLKGKGINYPLWRSRHSSFLEGEDNIQNHWFSPWCWKAVDKAYVANMGEVENFSSTILNVLRIKGLWVASPSYLFLLEIIPYIHAKLSVNDQIGFWTSRNLGHQEKSPLAVSPYPYLPCIQAHNPGVSTVNEKKIVCWQWNWVKNEKSSPLVIWIYFRTQT